MIAHQELVDRVAAHDGVASPHEARSAARAVVAALAPKLRPDLRERLRQALPASLWRVPANGDGDGGTAESGDLAQRAARELGCPPERALHLARAVLAEIALCEPELSEELTAALPGELAQWTADPLGAAGRSDTGATGAPSRIDGETLRAAQRRLPEWEGDTGGLTRVVQLPRDRARPLIAGVQRIGRELDHPAHHELTEDGVAFTVRTNSVGAVTTRDIELAERIDQAIAEVGSGG